MEPAQVRPSSPPHSPVWGMEPGSGRVMVGSAVGAVSEMLLLDVVAVETSVEVLTDEEESLALVEVDASAVEDYKVETPVDELVEVLLVVVDAAPVLEVSEDSVDVVNVVSVVDDDAPPATILAYAQVGKCDMSIYCHRSSETRKPCCNYRRPVYYYWCKPRSVAWHARVRVRNSYGAAVSGLG